MATLIDSEMSTWAPDTRHYLTDDGRHVAVHVHADPNERTAEQIRAALSALGTSAFIHTIAEAPTTVVECTAEGLPITLDPLATFPPGTSHEEAIAQLEQE